MSEVIAITNQKGGVGKTVTAINLAAGIAMRNYDVLIIDLDIQANTTHILYKTLDPDEESIADVLINEHSIERVIRETNIPHLYLAPSSDYLAVADISLASKLSRETILQHCLEDGVKDRFDFIIIDTAPYLGLLTLNGIMASDHILIPVSCEYLPLMGIKILLDTLEKIKKRMRYDINILGFLLTMYDKRENITIEVEELLRERFGDKVFKKPIRINTKLKACTAQHMTIFEYESSKRGKGTEDYTALTEETLSRLGYPLKKEVNSSC
ncbi:MAG: ParA family protein [Nitrospirae bacterium]|nr:MAG: ParA family protein [Nitrospirota bacterium]